MLSVYENTVRTGHRIFSNKSRSKRYVMINEHNFFWSISKKNEIIYDNIRKIAAGQVCNYTTGCPLDYPYLKENYKIIAIDLSKQHVFDADPKAIQQINFIGNLEHVENATSLSRKSKNLS